MKTYTEEELKEYENLIKNDERIKTLREVRAVLFNQVLEPINGSISKYMTLEESLDAELEPYNEPWYKDETSREAKVKSAVAQGKFKQAQDDYNLVASLLSSLDAVLLQAKSNITSSQISTENE